MNDQQIKNMATLIKKSVNDAEGVRVAAKRFTDELATCSSSKAVICCGSVILGLAKFSTDPKIQKARKQAACRMTANSLKKAFPEIYKGKKLTFSTQGVLKVANEVVKTDLDKFIALAEKIGFTIRQVKDLTAEAESVVASQTNGVVKATVTEAPEKLEETFTTLPTAPTVKAKTKKVKAV